MSSSSGLLVKKRATPPPRSASSWARKAFGRRVDAQHADPPASACSGLPGRPGARMRAASLTWASVTTSTCRARSTRSTRFSLSACSRATPRLVPPLSRFSSRYRDRVGYLALRGQPRLRGEPLGGRVKQPQVKLVALLQPGQKTVHGPVGGLPLGAAHRPRVIDQQDHLARQTAARLVRRRRRDHSPASRRRPRSGLGPA